MRQRLADVELVRLALDYPDEYGPHYKQALEALDRLAAREQRLADNPYDMPGTRLSKALARVELER